MEKLSQFAPFLWGMVYGRGSRLSSGVGWPLAGQTPVSMPFLIRKQSIGLDDFKVSRSPKLIWFYSFRVSRVCFFSHYISIIIIAASWAKKKCWMVFLSWLSKAEKGIKDSCRVIIQGLSKTLKWEQQIYFENDSDAFPTNGLQIQGIVTSTFPIST